ncbi:MAG: cation diffusion facilitator family transporter [Planctomycetota bacterium]
MAHDHHHGPRGLPGGHLDRAMLIGVGLNVAFVAVELVAGFLAGSLALLADAGHNASDVLGLLLAWGADWLSRRPPSRRYTWGLGRSTILAALANAVLLLVACGAILWEAWHRLREPASVTGTTVIAVAAIGVVINTLTALLFVRGHADANVRGAFLHMAADAAVSAGVVVAGIAIAITGLGWIDPVVSIVIAAVIVVGTWGLFRESLDLALDAVPRGVDVGAIEEALAAVPGVVAVEDLHVWGPSTSEVSLTAHLAVSPDAESDTVLAEATRRMRQEFHVAHSTIQVERQR